jgi:hypothetical protein
MADQRRSTDSTDPDVTPKQNGKLSIPLPFETALKAATEVPADRLAPPEKKRKSRAKKPARG